MIFQDLVPHWPIPLAGGALLASIFTSGAPDIISRYRDASTYSNFSCYAVDGDTLNCAGERIRLLGVDSAEMPGHCRPGRDCAPGDPFAQKAALAAFLRRGPITVRPITTDPYGRTVASVTDANGNNASCAALRAGARYVAEWDSRSQIRLTCAIETAALAERAHRGPIK